MWRDYFISENLRWHSLLSNLIAFLVYFVFALFFDYFHICWINVDWLYFLVMLHQLCAWWETSRYSLVSIWLIVALCQGIKETTTTLINVKLLPTSLRLLSCYTWSIWHSQFHAISCLLKVNSWRSLNIGSIWNSDFNAPQLIIFNQHILILRGVVNFIGAATILYRRGCGTLFCLSSIHELRNSCWLRIDIVLSTFREAHFKWGFFSRFALTGWGKYLG